VLAEVLKPEASAWLLASPALAAAGITLKIIGHETPAASGAGPGAPFVRVLLPLLQEWAKSRASLVDRAHAHAVDGKVQLGIQGQRKQRQLQQQQMQQRVMLGDAGAAQALHLLHSLHLSPEVQGLCNSYNALLYGGNAAAGLGAETAKVGDVAASHQTRGADGSRGFWVTRRHDEELDLMKSK